jgi:methionine synthase I (cobalamin-dependent)
MGYRDRLPQLDGDLFLTDGGIELGGCCGTDHRHVREVCRAWLAGPAASAG